MDDGKALSKAPALSPEARRWQEENREAIEAWNKWDEENPLITDEYAPSS